MVASVSKALDSRPCMTVVFPLPGGPQISNVMPGPKHPETPEHPSALALIKESKALHCVLNAHGRASAVEDCCSSVQYASTRVALLFWVWLTIEMTNDDAKYPMCFSIVDAKL